MIRSELVARIAEQNPHLYAQDAELIVDAILGKMADALANDDRVELRGFGTFSTKEKAARSGRDPRTGAAVEVPAKRTIHFKMGRLMQDRLNRTKIVPEEEAERLLRTS